MTETKAFNPEMKRVGKRKKFTQVKCFGIFSTDLTTARISLRQEIPISDALILDGFPNPKLSEYPFWVLSQEPLASAQLHRPFLQTILKDSPQQQRKPKPHQKRNSIF